ncbi:PQQ-binding-like beta-propeller repeat protein [Mycobacterium sp. 852013-50091_SCH5140682]|uniref:outer membrane protein assembly factor BamB family protein n=1 Tax=Mycobacterium sp. 852013-50091_SCH5140682 TaxID=1834109 RepID=UPI0012EA958F|nr:PQQ-binding-like beta-propeller repeat protein [Mycobacterium sp. 852013-50091_SCH5140682]
MPDVPVTERPRSRVRSAVSSICIGCSAAAAVGAILIPITMWATSSPTDMVEDPQTGTAVATVIIGVCVLFRLAPRLIGRRPPWVATMLADVVAVTLGVWVAWSIYRTYRARAALALVDSTGASVLVVEAMLTALVAVALGVTAAAGSAPTNRRIALCAFAVVAVVLPVAIHRSVDDYRARVWHPSLTASAAAPAPVPSAIGPVKYQLSYPRDFHPVGTGFILTAADGVTAYDGRSGAVRWRATGFGPSSVGARHGVAVARRDGDDPAGVVVLFLGGALIALDGSTGNVIWRRQHGGTVTAAAGGVDALGMTVFTADDSPDRTRFYSLDPANGQLRWTRPTDCSDPTLAAGTPGQFAYRCGMPPTVIDARTGKTTDMPGEYNLPETGSDVYVCEKSETQSAADAATAAGVIQVIDPTGQVVDEIRDARPVSRANNGLLLVYSNEGAWLMRNYRTHQSTPVPVQVDVRNGVNHVQTTWIKDGLVVASGFDGSGGLQLIDTVRPSEVPTSTESPCRDSTLLQDLYAVAGAIVVTCTGGEIFGLVSDSR